MMYLLSDCSVEYYDKLYAYPNEPSSAYAFYLNYEKPAKALRELAMLS